MESHDEEKSLHFLSLPAELLVYIISLLPTIRDKVKLRYVSRRLRDVSETPSLWREFVWPLFDKREERSVMGVFKDCGEYIKRLVFPDHVTTLALNEMLIHCNNVTQLSLPPGMMTKLDSEQLGIALRTMNYLENLEVQLSGDIKPLLQTGRLRELTVHIKVKPRLQTLPFCMSCVQEWVAYDFVPCKLNIVSRAFVDQLQIMFLESWMQWNSTISESHSACLKLYDKFRSILNFSPVFPTIQLEFSEVSTLPLVKTSSIGLLGLDKDLVLFTDSIHDNKTTIKAKIVEPDILNHVLNHTMNHDFRCLKFVTDFDFSLAFLYSGHLEQLAVACPNIQRLNLSNNTGCLRSLKGLRKIAQCCSDLCGLNLFGISVDTTESHIQVWNVLSEMKKLSHLAFEACLLGMSVSTDVNLCNLLSKFCSLQGLEFGVYFSLCDACFKCESQMSWAYLFLSSFPSLRHCICVCDDPDSVQDMISNCGELTYLYCHCYDNLSLSSALNSNLQQLSIVSNETDIPDIFLETVSAHSGLVHIGLAVNSVTIKGVTSLIENSYKLLTLVVYTCKSIRNERGFKVNLTKFKGRVKKLFPCRKLFTVGTFKMVQNDEFATTNLEDCVPNTDLASLWL